MRPFPSQVRPSYIVFILYVNIDMTNYLMRKPLARQPELRTPGNVEVEGTDEVTTQRYLVLAALKAPQNLPQHDLEIDHYLNQRLPFTDIETSACAAFSRNWRRYACQ